VCSIVQSVLHCKWGRKGGGASGLGRVHRAWARSGGVVVRGGVGKAVQEVSVASVDAKNGGGLFAW
jgi:hypothetical protein